MQTAAIYARVSTDWQAEHGYSLETQIAACEKYARDLGAASVTAKLEALTSEAKRIQEKLAAPKTNERAVDVARIYNLVKSCDGSFDAKKNIVHAIIASIDYERVDETHKNGKYDIKFLIHFV